MYRLMSSGDCGASYQFDSEAKTIKELQARMDELDEDKIRWYVKNSDGSINDEVESPIHKHIRETFI